MRVTIAGNVTNSVFASSVAAGTNGFGSPDDLRLQPGTINARIQGTIDNSTATPRLADRRLLRQGRQSHQGPVAPPTFPEAPYAGPLTPRPCRGRLPTPTRLNPKSKAVPTALGEKARSQATSPTDLSPTSSSRPKSQFRGRAIHGHPNKNRNGLSRKPLWTPGTRNRSAGAVLRPDGAVGDIAAIPAAGEADGADGLVDAGLGVGEGCAQGGDVEDAAAIGDDPAVAAERRVGPQARCRRGRP